MYGRNFTGRGRRQENGLGFRGDSPPWPYVGRGRGGLPRCSYPGLIGATAPVKTGSSAPAVPARDAELGVLRRQAEATRQPLPDMEGRIQELEKKEEN
jgi:hypothetical protein